MIFLILCPAALCSFVLFPFFPKGIYSMLTFCCHLPRTNWYALLHSFPQIFASRWQIISYKINTNEAVRRKTFMGPPVFMSTERII